MSRQFVGTSVEEDSRLLATKSLADATGTANTPVVYNCACSSAVGVI